MYLYIYLYTHTKERTGQAELDRQTGLPEQDCH